MEEISRILGDSVKQARERLNMTQSQVSEEAQINNQTVLKIENYKGNPTLEILHPLIRTLKIDPREIFYPELQQDSPEMCQLRMLLETCSPSEVTALLTLVQAFLTVVRDEHPVPTH